MAKKTNQISVGTLIFTIVALLIVMAIAYKPHYNSLMWALGAFTALLVVIHLCKKLLVPRLHNWLRRGFGPGLR